MSHSLHVTLEVEPSYEEPLEAVSVPLETSDGPPEELVGPWEEGHVLAVWQPGVSTRPIELSWEDGTFAVRILACSCPEDYELAVAMVSAVADLAGEEVESEEGVRFAPEDREAHHGRAWIDEHVRSTVSAVLAHLESEDGGEAIATMAGPTRDFHLGPRVRAELEAVDPDARVETLFERMRALFYPDEELYYGANVLVVRREDGTEFTTAAFAPGVGYVFPPAEHLTILDQPPFEIRFDDLATLLGEDSVTWMDDRSPRVEALHGSKWDAFVERARERAVRVDGGTGDPQPEGSAGRLPVALVVALVVVAIAVAFLLRG